MINKVSNAAAQAIYAAQSKVARQEEKPADENKSTGETPAYVVVISADAREAARLQAEVERQSETESESEETNDEGRE